MVNMHLVEIFLPLADNHGASFPHEKFLEVQKELVAEFGGVTAYPRAPASGVWKQGIEELRDDLVVYEILCHEVDRDWWRRFRELLEKDFDQEEIMIRSHVCQKL